MSDSLVPLAPLAAFDPKLDLVLERYVDVAPELVWAAWTEPEHIKHWFTPSPWKTVDCTIDLRPGGMFHTVMQSPEGQNFPNAGCYLEVTPNRRLIWTNAMAPGFRPATAPDLAVVGELVFTGVISLQAKGSGTVYTATVLHRDEATCKRHDDMGFQHGWGSALDQLVAHMKKG